MPPRPLLLWSFRKHKGARGRRRLPDSAEFADLVGELSSHELKLDMLGVERTASRRSEAGANRPNPFDSAAELQTFDPNRRGSSMPCRKDRPHVCAEGVHRALEVLQPCWECRGARKASVYIVEQTAERNQLLRERLIGHIGASFIEKASGSGNPARAPTL
jgi:hypothetical protein